MDVRLLLMLLSVLLTTSALDNGLARLPPMGWMTSERFGCNVDCTNYPDDCISEKLIQSTADAMVGQGLKEAGYKYVAVGDCWQAKSRDAQGHLQANSNRFPSGIKSLASYVHQRGLKLGLYLDVGSVTCNGYPGSRGHLETDAQTLASWEVDMVKVGGCNVSDGHYFNTAFPELGTHLNKTGRPILYMCEWPLLLTKKGMHVDYAKVASVCNQYRTHKDILDSWESLEENVKYYADQGQSLVNYSGPGSWNDVDQLLVGDFGLSVNQQRIQMSLMCILAAPLFVSADVRHVRAEARSLLLSRGTLAINQDPLALMGTQVTVKGQVHIWKKQINPAGSFALALMYFNISGGPTKVSVKLNDIGLHTAAAYNLTEVYTGTHMGIYKPWHTLDCEVNPTGVLLIKAIALP